MYYHLKWLQCGNKEIQDVPGYGIDFIVQVIENNDTW